MHRPPFRRPARSSPDARPESTPSVTPDPAPAPASARIPSLDGFRGISIILVLLGHLVGTAGFPPSAAPIIHNGYLDVANLGVRVFFVISGLLITLLLLRELEKTGRVSLRHFFFRRAFRILPAYIAFVVVTIVAWRAGLVSLTGRDLAHALTFTVNYDASRSWGIGHLWSLSVEEQFYLLWPSLIALGGLARGVRWARALLVIGPLARLTWITLAPDATDLNGSTFETAADAVAAGCLLAVYRETWWKSATFRERLLSNVWLPIGWAIALGLALRTRSQLVLGIPLQNICIALTIERAVRDPSGMLSRVLNWKPLASIGLLSYSIYLWQQHFLNRGVAGTFTAFPANIAVAAVLALVSYFWVEQPMLRLRERIEARWKAREAATVA